MRAFRSISDSVIASKKYIECRVQRGNIGLRKRTGGAESHMLPYEDYFVDEIIKLSRCGHYVFAAEGLQFINSLTEGICMLIGS